MSSDFFAIIPFYAGNVLITEGNPDRRVEYLKKTTDNIKDIGWSLLVGVCSEADRSLVPSSVETVLLEPQQPRLLPMNLIRYAQKNLDEKHIYYTESDQILHYNDYVFDYVVASTYLTPHRLEQLGPKGQGRNRGAVIEWDNREWLLFNGVPEGDGFYHPYNRDAGYGGAFFCEKKLLDKVAFDDVDYLPLEHASGHHMYQQAFCLKTSKLEDLFVEHLSGYDYHEKLEA